ncbi:MAG: sugar ABC transporter permease [Chloroflexi bacterium]|nr:sugar ABC transporter permease [Chloroflexota bacterium]MCC6891461.1 sugar ABC transporter permease [Anaerolineae bacterium]
MASVDTAGVLTSPREAPKRRTLQQQQRIWGWIFLSPWILGFVLFTAAPMIASLIFTFTDFSLSRPEMSFVGLKNWQNLFNDPLAIIALGVTIKYALIAVPIGILVPLGLAALLNSKHLFGKRIWRTIFYLPYMVPAVSSIFIWRSFLNGETGWLNRLLIQIGITDPPNWLQSEAWILQAFVLIGLWGVGNAMLTMLATMQGVPTELYEAADVDGANGFTKFLRITLPMISPVIFYNLVLSVIGVMQYFEVPYIATLGTGHPGTSAYFYNMHLYKTAFTYFDMGYGSTLAWLMFIIALALTAALFATSRRWVYYSSGD